MNHGEPPRTVTAKRGMEFIHAVWLDDLNKPLRCRVTAVRGGGVYWKGVYADGSLGKSTYCDASDFPSRIKEVLLDD